jgi:hypothetical protein
MMGKLGILARIMKKLSGLSDKEFEALRKAYQEGDRIEREMRKTPQGRMKLKTLMRQIKNKKIDRLSQNR